MVAPIRNEPRVQTPPRPPPPPPAPKVDPKKAKGPGPAAGAEQEGPNPVEVGANSTKLMADTFLANSQEKKTGTRAVGGVPIPGGRNSSTVEGRNSQLGRLGNGLGTASSAAGLLTAGDKIGKINEARQRGDTRAVVEEGSSLASTALNAGKGALETGSQLKDFRTVRNSARDAIVNRAAQDGVNVSRSDATKIARQNARDALEGVGRNQARDAARNAATSVGQREALRGASQAGSSAARTAVSTGAATAAKTAGRFVPGLNAAIAVADTANAVAVMKSDASVAKKGAAVITAAGSWAAASNIPGVSQAGAVVSTASSLIGSLF